MNNFKTILWLVLGGLKVGFAYILGGLLTCATIVGIPYGKQLIRNGVATLVPFERKLSEPTGDGGTNRTASNVIWFLLVGWVIAAAHAISALLFAATVVGMPFAQEHKRLIPLAVQPMGRTFQ